MLESWDRGSKYLRGAPKQVTPQLVITVYLYRHYIIDYETFLAILKIYKQRTEPGVLHVILP